MPIPDLWAAQDHYSAAANLQAAMRHCYLLRELPLKETKSISIKSERAADRSALRTRETAGDSLNTNRAA